MTKERVVLSRARLLKERLLPKEKSSSPCLNNHPVL